MTDIVEGLLEGTLDQCVHCGHSTAFGSGRYVNRTPVNDGWGCAECSGFKCDRCDKQIYLDAEVTPDQCSKTYTVENGVPVFSDGASEVHEACLTETEGQHFRGEVFTRSDVDHTTGGCLRGSVELVPARLVEIFGAPDRGEEFHQAVQHSDYYCKTSGEYTFKNNQGETFHLYDWKATALWEDGLPEVDEFWSDQTLFEFNVGGNSNANAFIAWITKEVAQ